MELEHTFTVPAGVGETWAHFTDIEGVAGCFPGATVTEADEESFKGTVKVKLGPIALVYNGTGTFVEKDEAARRMVIEAKGKDKRGNGTAGAHVTVTMAEGDAGRTDVAVATDLSITGKAAQFGRAGVIKDVSDKLLGQFVSCLEHQLAGSPDTSAEQPSPAPDPEPVAEPDPAAPGAGAVGTPTGGAAVPDPSGPPPLPDAAAPRRDSPPRQQDDALDLGSTVLPVLVRAYWKPVVAVVVVALVLIVWLIA